jgi:hypothetical protein
MNAASKSMIATGLLALSAVTLSAVPALAQAQQHHSAEPARAAAPGRGYIYDNRFNHGHYYPGPGTAYRALPPGAYESHYAGSSWYFNGGAWYRPYGPRYIVSRPPYGIGIRFLPPYYTTVWFGGIPYYYADDIYYLWSPARQEYVVSEAPADETTATTTPPANTELYAYPKSGQSDEQQKTDRYECHRWASDQTGFDPTQPLGGVSAQESANKRADYLRADRTCLEGRGYSVN